MAQKPAKAPAPSGTFVTLNKDNKPVWEPGLSTEVTTRQRVVRKRNVQDTPVPCDLRTILRQSPEERAEWLDRALNGVPRGLAKPQDIFEIVTHRKFVSEVARELGESMLHQLRTCLMFFTERQHLTIARCRLVQQFKAAKKEKRTEDASDEERERPPSGDENRSRSRSRGGAQHRRFEEERKQAVHEAMVGGSDAAKEEEDSCSPEERARIDEEFREREKAREAQNAERRKRLEAERKAQEEREKKRKAMIASAFLLDDEEEEEDDEPPQPLVVRRIDRSNEDQVLGYGSTNPSGSRFSESEAGAASVALTTHSSAPEAVEAMGGDSVVSEAHKILAKGAGAFLGKKSPPRQSSPRRQQKSRSPSRRRSRSRKQRSRSRRRSRSRGRRRSRSPSRRPARDHGQRGGGGASSSLRSPTPDGHLRGQMRAARKAKMIMQMMRQGQTPRVE